MESTFILIGASLVLLSILLSPLSSRVGMPVLLLFLGIGMLAGEDGIGKISFHDAELVFLVANLGLAVILLDGGIRTRVSVFRVGLRPALILASVGILVTAGLTGLAAAWLLDLPLILGLLIGAIISSTDAAAVFSLLQGRGLKINERVEATLEIESGSNDPMAIFLTLLLIQILQNDAPVSLLSAIGLLVKQFGLGALLGVASGLLLAVMINRISLVTGLYPLMVAAFGISVFALTNELGGSGFLAIYLMGVTTASRPIRRMPQILQVHDGLAWLAQVVLFLLLGLLVTPSALMESALPALGVAMVLILIARPIATTGSLLPFGFSAKEHLFIAWVGLRGAVPIVLALFPLIAGVPQSDLIFEVAFVVVLVSLLLQGSTLAPLARWLGLEIPEEKTHQTRLPLEHAVASDHEILLVPLMGARWQAEKPLEDVIMPERCVIGGLFREGLLIDPRPGVTLREGDLVVVLSPASLANDIGHIFGWKEPPERLSDQRFFGEFVLNGSARVGDVSMAYGVQIERFRTEQTLSECFSQTRHGHPVVGDRLDLGNLLLTVRAVSGDEVTQVGLKLRK